MPLIPKSLEPKIAAMLQDRLADEYTAHYFYVNAKNYCENVGYENAAKYFQAEAASELEHAAGLQKYLTDWNVLPMLKPLSSPQQVNGLVDIIEKAYKMEYGLYEKYEDISMAIFEIPDPCTFDFLQKYRTIQRESVAEYSTLLNQLVLIDSDDKNWLQEFEENHFE